MEEKSFEQSFCMVEAIGVEAEEEVGELEIELLDEIDSKGINIHG